MTVHPLCHSTLPFTNQPQDPLLPVSIQNNFRLLVTHLTLVNFYFELDVCQKCYPKGKQHSNDNYVVNIYFTGTLSVY